MMIACVWGPLLLFSIATQAPLISIQGEVVYPEVVFIRPGGELPMGRLPVIKQGKLNLDRASRLALKAAMSARRKLDNPWVGSEKVVFEKEAAETRKRALRMLAAIEKAEHLAIHHALLWLDEASTRKNKLGSTGVRDIYARALDILIKGANHRLSTEKADVALHYLQGYVYELLNYDERAVNAYFRALQRGQSRLTPEVNHRLGDLLSDRRIWPQAVEHYRSVVFGETRPMAIAKLAWTFWRMGQCEDVAKTAAAFRREVMSEADRDAYGGPITSYESDCALTIQGGLSDIARLDPDGQQEVGRATRRLKARDASMLPRTLVLKAIARCYARVQRFDGPAVPVKLALTGTLGRPRFQLARGAGLDPWLMLVAEKHKPQGEPAIPEWRSKIGATMNWAGWVSSLESCMAKRLEGLSQHGRRLRGEVTLHPEKSDSI